MRRATCQWLATTGNATAGWTHPSPSKVPALRQRPGQLQALHADHETAVRVAPHPAAQGPSQHLRWVGSRRRQLAGVAAAVRGCHRRTWHPKQPPRILTPPCLTASWAPEVRRKQSPGVSSGPSTLSRRARQETGDGWWRTCRKSQRAASQGEVSSHASWWLQARQGGEQQLSGVSATTGPGLTCR